MTTPETQGEVSPESRGKTASSAGGGPPDSKAAPPRTTGNTADQNRLKPCIKKVVGSMERVGMESQKGNSGLGWIQQCSGWRETAAVATLSLALGFIFSYPLLTALSVPSGFYDWDFHLTFSWVQYDTIWRFHQIPLWNPYKCGGLPALGNPQDRVLTPFTLVHLLAGPIAGLYLEVPLHFAVAWAGGYVLARVVGISRLAAIGAATVFPASSWYALHATVGHADLFSFALLPWVLAPALLAAERHRLSYTALSGAALALSFLDGSPYPTAYAFLLLATVLPAWALYRRSAWPFLVLGLALLFGAGLMAVKLLPSIDVLREHPRPILVPEVNDYRVLGQLLLSRNQDYALWTNVDWTALSTGKIVKWGFWESGAYVGLFIVPAIIGAVCGGAAALVWLFAGACMLLIWMGSHGPFWPWEILHHLPVFSAMRVPSRAIIPFTLTLAVLAGFGLDWISKHVRRFGPAIALGLIAVATIDCLLVGTPNYWNVVSEPESDTPPLPSDGFHQVFRVVPHHELNYARHDAGAKYCYEFTYFWPTRVKGYDQSEYQGEQYVNGPGAVLLEKWTPNALEYDVDTDSPSELVINQNYYPSWQLTGGTGQVFEFGPLPPSMTRNVPVPGLLAVHVPAGHQRVELRYRPASVIKGTAITLITLLMSLALWFVERHKAITDENLASSPQGGCFNPRPAATINQKRADDPSPDL